MWILIDIRRKVNNYQTYSLSILDLNTILVTFGQICNFRNPNLATLY